MFESFILAVHEGTLGSVKNFSIVSEPSIKSLIQTRQIRIHKQTACKHSITTPKIQSMKNQLSRTLPPLTRQAATFIISYLFVFGGAQSAGIDVQLKDLKRSFFIVKNDKNPSCKLLDRFAVSEFGKFNHCRPTDTFIECPTLKGGKILVFESQKECLAFAGSDSAKRVQQESDQ